MAVTTPQFRMADRMAGGNLAALILADKAAHFSAEEIARRLYADFGIEVTGQTLRRWLRELDDQAPIAEAAS